jgi:hypothetical protein
VHSAARCCGFTSADPLTARQHEFAGSADVLSNEFAVLLKRAKWPPTGSSTKVIKLSCTPAILPVLKTPDDNFPRPKQS